MQENLKKIYINIITFCAFGILVALSCFSVNTTAYLIEWEHTVFVEDSVCKHMLIIISFLAFSVFVRTSSWYKVVADYVISDNNFCKIKCGAIICIFAMGSIWAISTQFIPGVDEYVLQDCVRDALNGNFQEFYPGAYMDQYPNQWGIFLAFYILGFFFGGMNHIVIELLIAFAIAMIFKQLSEIAELNNVTKGGQLLILLIGILYIPFTMYSNMIYGNMIGVAFALTSIKYCLFFGKDYRKINAIKCAVCITLAILMKSNMQIYFVALVITIIVKLIAEKENQFLFLLGVIVMMYMLQSVVVRNAVEIISGYQFNQPLSSWSWIAMGLQEGKLAPGWWNEYTIKSYAECAGNTEQHAVLAINSIRNSIENFFENPSYAISFFTEKINSTWSNPSFQCFATVRNGSYVEIPQWVEWVLTYNGQYHISKFLNVGCLMIYLFALFDLVCKFPLQQRVETLILPMIFVGGFVFYLFWETKSRYALMFFVVLIPNSVNGYIQMTNILVRLLSKIRGDEWCINILRWCKRRIMLLSIFLLVISVYICLYATKYNYLLCQDTEKYYEYIHAGEKNREIVLYVGHDLY